jgi:hypothetical protein
MVTQTVKKLPNLYGPQRLVIVAGGPCLNQMSPARFKIIPRVHVPKLIVMFNYVTFLIN